MLAQRRIVVAGTTNPNRVSNGQKLQPGLESGEYIE